MKKLLAIFLLLSFFSVNAFAEEDEGYWPRSYFAGLGFSVVATRGDIGEYTVTGKTDKGDKETAHLPSINIFILPDVFLGVNIGQFTLSANYNYWKFNDVLGGIPDNSIEERVRIWRFGVEFVYNIFWPEFFQPGIGIGYAYTSIKTENSVFPEDESKKKTASELMGSSLSLILDIRYYLTEHIVLQPSIKFNEAWFSNINTENAGTNALKHKMWQTFSLVELAIIYQF
ncbi:outer membrane beta-barrel protein [uncultured Fibrobacter sp.]|uniref:outer membrane beta-barrel protein n=1 Tax=uncultured Fibrobacter sp. TaxID=261512 RepID=UPI0025CE3A00|nr:outer membrane beta-barrel protein [uncultured Fibrobacter sp.]